MAELLIKRLGPHAQLPVWATSECARYDLISAEEKNIEAHTRQLVDTQLSMALPTGTYGCIAPRSGLAAKSSIDIGAGVIDPGYHGPVKVLMINNSDKIFSVRVGDRVAQLILEKMATPQILETDNLPSAEWDQREFSSIGLASPDDRSPLFGHSLAMNTMEDLEDISNVEQVIVNILWTILLMKPKSD